MIEYPIALAPPLSEQHAAELARRVYYLDTSIVDFRLERTTGVVDGIVLVTDRAADPGELARSVQTVLTNEIRPQLSADPKVLWRSPCTTTTDDVLADLLASDVVNQAGDGRITLGGSALAVLDSVDRTLRDMAVDIFGAREFRYPTLIALSALRDSGYLAAFPQHLMFVTRPRGDLDTYRAVAADPGDLLSHCADVTLALPPTMCYHTFAQHSGTTLTSDRTVVTARGASFRHESRYHHGLERLADFTIRETVFLGSAQFARQARDTFRAHATQLVERLGLTGHCEVANDPFFCKNDTADQISAQRLLELKHELHVGIGGGRTIAVGSFNLHDQHFGTTFDIRGAAGAPVATSCVGFGLERLTYSLYCHYGPDTAAWPEAVRRTLRGARRDD